MEQFCVNTLRIEGTGALACYEAIRGEGGGIDLDRVVSTPAILKAIPDGRVADYAKVILGETEAAAFIDSCYAEPAATAADISTFLDLRIHLYRTYPEAAELIRPMEAAWEATGFLTPPEFHRQRWGTPSNGMSGSAVRADEDHVVVHFRTVETGPVIAVKTVSEQYPDLKFTLYTCASGNEMYAEDSWKDGSTEMDYLAGWIADRRGCDLPDDVMRWADHSLAGSV